jgi:hypothetical protein
MVNIQTTEKVPRRFRLVARAFAGSRRSAVDLGNPAAETDSMAEDAVTTNRSLVPNSLLAGNLQGIFADFGGGGRF